MNLGTLRFLLLMSTLVQTTVCYGMDDGFNHDESGGPTKFSSLIQDTGTVQESSAKRRKINDTDSNLINPFAREQIIDKVWSELCSNSFQFQQYDFDRIFPQYPEYNYDEMSSKEAIAFRVLWPAFLELPKQYLSKAINLAVSGDLYAQFNLGVMYEQAWGIEANYSKAAFWYGKAAAQDYAPAQFNLGMMYEQAWGIEANYSKAVFWYGKAAAQDYAPAQFNLGVMYELGRGVDASYSNTAFWYGKAAAQDYAPAQFNLGALYELGWGVEKSDEEAIKWYCKAADQNYVPACKKLSSMNIEGRDAWRTIQDLYQSWQHKLPTEDPSSFWRGKLINKLNIRLIRGELTLQEKEQALTMAQSLNASNLAVRIKQYKAIKDYGNFNILPHDMIQCILGFCGNGQTNLKDLDTLLQLNKSFHTAMMSTPLHLDLWSYEENITDDILAKISEVFPKIASFNLTNCYNITDKGIAHLSMLNDLTYLNLSSCTEITDAGLLYLKGLPKLSTLILDGNEDEFPITNAGLAHIGNLRNLTTLVLKRFPLITDNGLAHIGNLPKLTTLELSECGGITPAGLAHLKRLPNLTTLSLSDHEVNNEAAFLELSMLPSLTTLDLSWCFEIPDTALVHLGKLHNLTTLILGDSGEITDAGLLHLAGLSNLTTLKLNHCPQITDAGRNNLKAILPKLNFI